MEFALDQSLVIPHHHRHHYIHFLFFSISSETLKNIVIPTCWLSLIFSWRDDIKILSQGISATASNKEIHLTLSFFFLCFIIAELVNFDSFLFFL